MKKLFSFIAIFSTLINIPTCFSFNIRTSLFFENINTDFNFPKQFIFTFFQNNLTILKINIISLEEVYYTLI